MKVVLSAICITSLLLAILSFLPQAIAQCLTKNDDLSKISTSTDLSGILDFNLQLFREMLPKDVKRNFIFSSYSIWNALTLSYFGASGRTEEQLREVLRLDDKLSTIKKWRALEYMYKRRPEASINNTFILANKAYFDKTIQLRSCMEDILHNEIEKIDFTKAKEAADHINAFVLEITKGTIQELVSSDDVNGANLVLANAAYFKGAWQYIFDIRATHPYPFTGLDGTHYTVDMMQQSGEFKYVYDVVLNVEVLELPYSGESISMILLKPLKNTQSNFNSLVQGLSMEKFEEIIGKMKLIEIDVKIPKFRLETTCGDDLLRALERMGLTDISNKGTADFTAFTLNRGISLDKSIHKAYIDVNEEGTEAAAATALISTRSGGAFSFVCSSPFLFMIRDKNTKNLLFMGAFKSSDKTYQSLKEPTNKNPNPVKPRQGEPNSDFSHDLFPTPSTSIRGSNQNPGQRNPSTGINGNSSGKETNQNPGQRNPSAGINGGSSGKDTNQNPGQRNPSTGSNGGSSGKETNQNPDRNYFLAGDNSAYIPNSVSDQNRNRVVPSSGGNNELIPDEGINSNPNQNDPPSEYKGGNQGFNFEGRNNQDSKQDKPSFRENRGDRRS